MNVLTPLFYPVGNQLGEQTEDIEELMSSFGRIDTLAPFDDNEDPDSDEGEDDDDEDGDTSINKSTNDDDESSANDIALQIKGMGLANDSPLLKEDVTNGDANEVIIFRLFLCLSSLARGICRLMYLVLRGKLITTNQMSLQRPNLLFCIICFYVRQIYFFSTFYSKCFFDK